MWREQLVKLSGKIVNSYSHKLRSQLMTEIKPIQNDYVTVKQHLGVINHGNGYAIVNIHTGECMARNISSFLDSVKTIDYILNGQSPPPPPPRNPDFLDELDMATVRSVVTYFEQWPNTIRRYYKDHNATYQEAEVICKNYLEMASQFSVVKTREDLQNAIQSVKTLKDKIARYKHHHHKYRWTTHLQKDVLDKLNPILSQFHFDAPQPVTPVTFEIESIVCSQEIKEKIKNIKKHSNRSSKFYGKLVNWH
ncbi:MAG: hypothetical protein RLZZ490_1048, partial [Cyanobacteriota bacterium]